MARDYQKTKENKRKAAAKRHASSITRFVGRNGPGGDNTVASTATTGITVLQDTPQINAHDNGADETVSNAEGNKCDVPSDGEFDQADMAAEDDIVRMRHIIA
jgi:hypothetical protein